MSPSVILCLFLAVRTAAPAADRAPVRPPPLTTAQQVRDLTEAAARAARPVRLAGVVTHVGPHPHAFYLQDRTAGVQVLPTPLAARLAQGDWVEVDGVTDPGSFAPCVSARAVKVVRSGAPLPDPLPFNLAAEEARWLDGQWVQAWVVVRGVASGPGVTRLQVYTAQGTGVLIVPGDEWAASAREMKGAALTVRGVCAAEFTDRAVSGAPRILLARMPDVSAAGADDPADPAAPPRLIDHLLRYSPGPHTAARRVKVAGVVTAAPVRGVLVVQDASGGATVWTDPPLAVPVGTRVEAVGLLRIDGRRVGLTRAAVTTHGPGPVPEPIAVRPADLAAGTRDGWLVRLEARVDEVRTAGRWTALTLTEGAVRFEAFVPATDRPPLPGSRVALTGVPLDILPDGRAAGGPVVYLGGPRALDVIAPPPTVPWWTADRVAYLSGGFLAVGLFGGGWLLTLRARVRRATAEVRRQFEEKTKLEAQLRQAAKLEAVGRLAGGIAHDFNNLLTVINGCAEILTDETAGSGRAGALADDIRRAGERAAALTGQLLTFSRKREVIITAIDLNEVVTDTGRLLDRVLGEDVRITTALTPGLPAVRGEPGLLHQVVMNLAVNARDAMPDGGTLALATAAVTEPPADPAGEPRQFVRLTVSDTGSGMTDEVKARIFEPFFTTKDVGKGTGLGLATVYGIVEALGGRIRVDSEVGRGTAFHIDLRVHADPASGGFASPAPRPARAATPESPATPGRLTGATVLLAEDNELVRAVLVAGLRGEGATVLVAPHPEAAVRLSAETPGRIDVLLTDVVMPGMSGRALADRVRIDRPGLKVVFMSGYTADEVLRQGVLEDQVEFLQKPFTPEHLTARLVKVLGRDPVPAA